MKIKAIAIVLFALLLTPVVGFAQEPTAEPTAEATEESVQVEAEAGDSVEVDTSEEGTTVIEVVEEDEVQPWEAENAEIYFAFTIFFAIGVYTVVNKFFGPEIKPVLDQVRPIVISVRDTAMGRAQEYVEGTPGTIDDRAFRILADELGYDVTKKAQG